MQYLEVNKSKRKEYKRIYEKNRRNKDVSYKLFGNVSSDVRRKILKYGGCKNNSTWTKLPYTPQQLKEHLEKQFTLEMNWSNYGFYWEIDHIYPQSKLSFDSLEHPNFLECWKLDNLRPLTCEENRKKRDQIISLF